MEYRKPKVEIVTFEREGFLTSSAAGGLIDGYCANYNFTGALGEMGYSCVNYTVGQSCSPFNTNGYRCSSYTGRVCPSVFMPRYGATYSNQRQNCNHF